MYRSILYVAVGVGFVRSTGKKGLGTDHIIRDSISVVTKVSKQHETGLYLSIEQAAGSRLAADSRQQRKHTHAVGCYSGSTILLPVSVSNKPRN